MKIKRNKKSYEWFLCGLILVVVLTITLIKGSKAGYRSTASIELTSGTVVSSPYDFKLISMYIDGVEQEKGTILPNNIANYTINEDETYCYKESKSNKDNYAKISINILGNLEVKGISKGCKCIISLTTKTETPKTMTELLNTHYTTSIKRKDGTFNQTIENTTYGTIYEAEDDDGTTYYFAGNPLDNFVEFGGYNWRIIRINGNGSIRLIGDARYTSIAFNEIVTDNAYAGFMYGTTDSSRYEDTHKNTNDSSIKKILDSWFNNSNLKQEQYFNKIDINAGFCGDRTSSTSETEINNQGGIGTVITRYGAYFRINSKTPNPTFKCPNSNDLYTHKSASRGNKALSNPVGLISVDEAAYAGLTYSSQNKSSYLLAPYVNITMSPFYFNVANGVLTVHMFLIHSRGQLVSWSANTDGYYRPVINLRSDVQFTGNGTQSNPFKVIVS